MNTAEAQPRMNMLEHDSRTMRTGLTALLCASIIALSNGCKTHSPSQIVAPQVIGRVVDARTLEPIAGVKVRREDSSQRPGPGEAQKGGQAITQPPVVRTKQDGTFILESVRDFALFRSVGWFVVKLTFEHPGYETQRGSYTQATESTPDGDPIVNTGDVRLRPIGK